LSIHLPSHHTITRDYLFAFRYLYPNPFPNQIFLGLGHIAHLVLDFDVSHRQMIRALTKTLRDIDLLSRISNPAQPEFSVLLSGSEDGRHSDSPLQRGAG
jgi:hypothetical protein